MTPQQTLHRLRLNLPRLAPLLREDVPLNELALDSMDHVELLCAIHEEFGVRLTPAELAPGASLTSLARHISSAAVKA
ncbi:acyl carrier protein [Prosthecobacter sp. SYSU 5D2]|uniref:acyl carrier protein n=1 Tax=Prosthecobacter sp. SYSU 5D2 TaxID=3134134 RepID=UPI0031FF3CC6